MWTRVALLTSVVQVLLCALSTVTHLLPALVYRGSPGGQVEHFVSSVGVAASGRHLNSGCVTGHPSFALDVAKQLLPSYDTFILFDAPNHDAWNDRSLEDKFILSDGRSFSCPTSLRSLDSYTRWTRLNLRTGQVCIASYIPCRVFLRHRIVFVPPHPHIRVAHVFGRSRCFVRCSA